MAFIEIDNVGLHYELIGPDDGPPVAITPGGRFSKEATGVRELALALADAGLRVLIWDRPNCGASDLHFSGSGESSMQAGFLLKLIRALDLGPTALVGGSAGARISLFVAKQDPSAVSRMCIWWISGGLISMMRLGSYYCCEPAEEAALRGMEAVAAMPIWAAQMQANPRNREIMLSFSPETFIERMEEWARGYVPSPDTPVGGIAMEDFRRMTMPVRVLKGSERDLYHPARICEQVDAALPNSQLIDPPWDLDVFAERMRDGSGLFSDWPLLAPHIVDFMRQ